MCGFGRLRINPLGKVHLPWVATALPTQKLLYFLTPWIWADLVSWFVIRRLRQMRPSSSSPALGLLSWDYHVRKPGHPQGDGKTNGEAPQCHRSGVSTEGWAHTWRNTPVSQCESPCVHWEMGTHMEKHPVTQYIHWGMGRHIGKHPSVPVWQSVYPLGDGEAPKCPSQEPALVSNVWGRPAWA